MGAAASSDSNVLPPLSTDISLHGASVDVDEALLLDLPEAFVYRLPPRTSAAGYAAESWGLDAPALTARLRVTSISPNGVCIILWRRAPEAAPPSVPPPIALIVPITMSPSSAGWLVVAVARWETTHAHPLSHWLEPVLDSSRYFVLRCQPPPRAAQNGGAASVPLIGVGFRLRESAFALKAVLSDYERGCARQQGFVLSEAGSTVTDIVGSSAATASEQAASVAAPPVIAAVSRLATAAPSALIPVLAPPRSSVGVAAAKQPAADVAEADDEFGDFS